MEYNDIHGSYNSVTLSSEILVEHTCVMGIK